MTPSPEKEFVTKDVLGRAVRWVSTDDIGISSKTIFAVMMGADLDDRSGFRFSPPHDPGDFGRCHRLLELIPEWRGRMGEVATVFPEWTGLLREWDRLAALFVAKKNAELYDAMKILLDEGLRAAGFVQTGPGSWSRDKDARLLLEGRGGKEK